MQKAPLGVRMSEWMAHNKGAQVAIMVLILVALGAIAYLVIAQPFASDSAQDQTDNGDLSFETGEQEVRQRLLDGVAVLPGEEGPVPVAVMVENLETVRPQAGLNQASIVYEALAEGGITRFMAIYPGAPQVERIGPVRSARHYYVDWAEEYGGLYLHAGGSPQALGAIGTTGRLTDVDQIGGDHGYFWRDQGLFAPHNLFTSGELIAFALRDTDVQSLAFAQWTFDREPPTGATAESVTIPFSSSAYEVQWLYEPNTTRYLRLNGGLSHVDALTQEPLSADTIIVQYVSSSLLESDTGRIDVETTGSGDALLIRDGVVVEGQWERTRQSERTVFTDAAGDPLPLKPGRTWVEVVPNDRQVTVD